MKPILKIKIAVDAAMSVSMLLLMAYGLVGEAAHEWIGMGMFALSVAHHILNHRWIQAVPRGRYTPLRVVQTALAGLIFLCMVGSMISGIVLSRHVFAFLPRHGGYELAQQVHILCAYWGSGQCMVRSLSDAEELVCICCSEATSYSTIIPSL